MNLIQSAHASLDLGGDPADIASDIQKVVTAYAAGISYPDRCDTPAKRQHHLVEVVYAMLCQDFGLRG